MENLQMFNQEERESLLKFVRDVIKSQFASSVIPQINSTNNKLDDIGSCFVTLHSNNGMLRGCIGNIAAFEPLKKNLERNAINAAFKDPRFPALDADELDDIYLELSILTPMQEIPSPAEFIVGKHGIVLQCQGRSAVFLPQVAPEQGWDSNTTLSHLSMKAGLPSNAWQRADAKFNVFEAVVFSEKDKK